jgi:thiol-disulfide isomerase/thioredoxin
MRFPSISYKQKKRITLILKLLVVVAIVLLALWLVKKFNTEGFESAPNLKPNNNECVVALFYADWCPHCVQFKPIFQQAKETMENKPCTASQLKGKSLRFEKVDCVAYPDLAKEYNVNGYPTVKLITSSGVEEYNAGRTLDSMNNYFFPN